MTTTKPQKDKPFAPAPKLVPRPTAASAARAALITNRQQNMSNNNTNVSSAQRTATNKSPSSPNLKKRVILPQRNPAADTKIDTNAKIDSNMDMKEEDLFEVINLQHDTAAVSENTDESSQDATKLDNDNDFENNGSDHTTTINTPISQPKSSEVSRPHTPKTPATTRTPLKVSRPSTPSCTLESVQHNTPASRPTTPKLQHKEPELNSNPKTQQQPQPSCPTPHEQAPSESMSLMNDTSLTDDSDMKSAYSAKEKQFQKLKKELDLKQQAVLEVFDSLRSLRERISQENVMGGGEGTLQELLVFNVADWPAEELSQLYRDAAVDMDGAVEFIDSFPVDEYSLNEVEAKVHSIPHQFADLCFQAFTARQEVIDWVKELLRTDNLQDIGEGETTQKIAHYNAQGLQLYEALGNLKNQADSTVNAVSYVSRRVMRDQTVLIAVGKSLVRDIARLKQELETHTTLINELRQHRPESGTNSIEETLKELEEEKSAKLALKDKLALSESQLRQTRNRIAKMDRQLHEAEASITTLTGTVKTLEEQSRQREAQIEARARKLRDTLKTGEVASGHLAQQRDALQAEVAALKEHIEQITAEHNLTINDLKDKLNQMKTSLEEQIELNHKREQELTEERDAALAESRNIREQLDAKIMELEKTEQTDDRNLPTAREMELLAELQATKVALHLVEDEVVVCKREKIRFLETLTKISDSENKIGMQQKLAAELVAKEELIGKMQSQMRELIKNDKLLEQKLTQYEHYINDLQEHNNKLNTTEDSKETNYQEAQKEILDLKMKLLETVHRNEELTDALAQKEQQLEHHDKTSRAQARVIKVREELINMLKNKETEQSRELSALQQDLEHRMKIVDEVNTQIAAKAVEIQELFATLESKQQQIHRLEKIVLALEEQQRRAQAQRTRHEEKIAALEHELAQGGRRERKFLFF